VIQASCRLLSAGYATCRVGAWPRSPTACSPSPRTGRRPSQHRSSRAPQPSDQSSLGRACQRAREMPAALRPGPHAALEACAARSAASRAAGRWRGAESPVACGPVNDTSGSRSSSRRSNRWRRCPPDAATNGERRSQALMTSWPSRALVPSTPSRYSTSPGEAPSTHRAPAGDLVLFERTPV
jgi:hypothetical protein